MIVVTGPTATGKTELAVQYARKHRAEIISADSRQVYRGMDIGTGKDLSAYTTGGQQIPFHLIDIADPGEEYNVFRYQQDFLNSYKEIVSRGKNAVLCGGTGLYIEAVLKGYRLLDVPENKMLRSNLASKTMQELQALLNTYKTPHNITDTQHRKRLIRAIEIQDYYDRHQDKAGNFPDIPATIFAVYFERSTLRERITKRLSKRLEEGMVEEAEHLLHTSVSASALKFYGLEYRYLTAYLEGTIAYDKMFSGLNTAIHQFAKRQMTWFRRMERQGLHIHWIDGNLPVEEKTAMIEAV
ncbi:MAG: tRNA (adenosine(37)-N6)-dimethylallyltransferase MiaA, partial [Bacteroidales bacterium]